MGVSNIKNKQTELGLIPEDWEVEAVGIVNNFIVPGRNKPKIFDGEIPWITTPDIEGNKISSSKLNLNISREEANNVGSKIVPKNSVVMTCVGDLGIVAYNKNEVVLNQQLHAFIPKGNMDFKFVMYALILQKKYMEKIATKTAVPYMNKDNCNSIPIPIPPKAEQQAIATTLSDVDALIETLDKLIEKKQQLKQGALQKLLKPKEGWVKKKLGDVAEINMGQSPNSTSYNTNGNGLPLIQGNADIKKRKQIVRNWAMDYTRTCEKGDIIMTVRAPVGLIGKAIQKSCIGRGVCSFNKLKISKNYFYHLMIQNELLWSALEQGSTFTAANANQIEKLELNFPSSIDEQEEISDILTDMDNELENLQTKLAKYKAMKLGMMQNLLTGKIRLV
jgi:type I restriction enzyme, S subunit